MTGLLICAAVVAFITGVLSLAGSWATGARDPDKTMSLAVYGLALIAAALYLAWRAGGAGV